LRPSGDQQAFTPTVKVAANGTVGVTYYDLRANTPDPGLPTNYWLVRCSSTCTSSAGWSETHVAGPFGEGPIPVQGAPKRLGQAGRWLEDVAKISDGPAGERALDHAPGGLESSDQLIG
jgi:hypothetical protein